MFPTKMPFTFFYRLLHILPMIGLSLYVRVGICASAVRISSPFCSHNVKIICWKRFIFKNSQSFSNQLFQSFFLHILKIISICAKAEGHHGWYLGYWSQIQIICGVSSLFDIILDNADIMLLVLYLFAFQDYQDLAYVSKANFIYSFYLILRNIRRKLDVMPFEDSNWNSNHYMFSLKRMSALTGNYVVLAWVMNSCDFLIQENLHIFVS